jgi:hypothetical protein
MNFLDPAASCQSVGRIIWRGSSVRCAGVALFVVIKIWIVSNRAALFELLKFAFEIEFATFEKLA